MFSFFSQSFISSSCIRYPTICFPIVYLYLYLLSDLFCLAFYLFELQIKTSQCYVGYVLDVEGTLRCQLVVCRVLMLTELVVSFTSRYTHTSLLTFVFELTVHVNYFARIHCSQLMGFPSPF
uniref:Uncharacterized protein n=1 Tax=Cacopsylla melanoneura TaxID=428564 RepID=A0A8D8M9E2_9HEMI